MSPSPRRQGLSPRQRRLLQASARAASSSSSAATSTPNKAANNDDVGNATTNSTTFSKRMEQKESQQSSSLSSLPSFPSTPISKKNENDEGDSLPHNYLNDVSLSPIYDDESTPIKRGSRLLSGATNSSDQTTPTDNISRRREVRKLGFGRYPSDEIPQQQLLQNDNVTRNRTNISSARFTSLSNNTNNSRAAGRTTTNTQKTTTAATTTAANNEEMYYYRITFKGVVSLLTQLYDDNDNINNDGKQQQQQRSSGIHVSYGEIVATSCPEISIPSFKDSNDDDNDDDESITMLKAIRVDSIVTGGYATDAIQEESISQSKSKLSTSYLSTSSASASLGFNRVNEDGHYHLGYLLLSNKDGQTIAEPYTHLNTTTTATASSSLCEHGSFNYRVNASSPVTVLSGPSLDAPPIRCALLPGTIHEVSLRISIPTSTGHHHHNHHDDNATNDDEKDTLGDDGDAEVVQFLRLGRRKGWVADRRIDDGNSNKLRVSFVMIDVSNEKGLNQTTIGSQSMSMSMSFEETSSLTSFALNSTANSSFYSSLQSSSVTTPAAVKAQRKRNIRRRATGADIARPTNIGDSFEEVESSITGGGGTTVVSGGGTTVISGDGSESSQNKMETCFLCRVIAPQGLKILDAPHFQVSNLIHSPTPTKVVPPRSSTSPGFSPFSRTNAMVAENSPTLTGGRKRNTSTVRYLTRGQFFEASQRMEVTGTSSLYTKGQGLVKLADGSGWAIIPYEDELVAQFKRLHGSEPDINDLNAARGFEEVGSAIIPKQLHRQTPSKKDKSLKDVIWFRVVAPNGVKILLPPKDNKKPSNSNHTTPSKIADRDIKIERSASSHESSEVASVASSSFLDSVWSRVKVTPSKERESAAGPTATAHAESRSNTPTKQATITVIPCGTVVPVESWDTSESPKSFVRLISQGWIPRSLGGMSYAVETGTPEIRIGSFWFRVKCSSGIDVRHGPSLNAPSISSESGTSFRFECGEYLRASEIFTSFDKQQQRRGRTLDDEDGPAVDCFAKLYRKSRVTNDSNQPLLNRYLSLQSYHAGGEWVQVFGNGQLLLEECSSAPSIERDRNGWRCTAVNEVQVRLGPSFHAGGTALSIHNGQEFYVVEKVTCHGEPIWMRLKDGEGWVPTMRESGEEVVHCYLQPNELNSQRMVRQILNNSSRTVY